jgi:carboxypeptidase PM20D1
MKNVLKYLAFALLALIAILLFNTFRISSKQMQGIAPAPVVAISDSAIAHLAEAVTYRTVSNADITQIDSAQFEKFIAFLARTYPLVHSKLKLEKINSYALFYEWKGKNPALKPALLMGHYDVVPVIQGTEKLWEHKPFAGEIAEGYLYGRGTLDDKVSVMGILEAVEMLLRQGYQPERGFYLSFGHDEEVAGRNGAQVLVPILESRKLQFEYIIDEGGVIKVDGLNGLKKPIALVGIAEKGYTTLELTATGEGGHSSMPPAQTSIGMLAEAIDKLQKHPFPARLEGVMSNMQDYLAPEMPFTTKLAMANRWLFKPIILKKTLESNVGAALVHTTTAPTIINAGVKDNVLPIEAVAKINFRILQGDSVAGVVNYVKKIIDNERITVQYNTVSGISDTASLGFRLIQRTIQQHFPNTIVAPNLVVAATDSRFFKNLSPYIYRFAPVRMTDDDLKRYHGTNERISVADFKNVVHFFVDLVKGS